MPRLARLSLLSNYIYAQRGIDRIYSFLTCYQWSTLGKTTAFAFALLTCHSCLIIPPPAPSPVPVSSDKKTESTQLEPGLEKTCYADALTESEGRKIIQSSESLATTADKLATAGKHKEAIRKYNEAEAATLNEAIADGRAEDMENYTGDVEGFRKENRPLIQKSAELNFLVRVIPSLAN